MLDVCFAQEGAGCSVASFCFITVPAVLLSAHFLKHDFAKYKEEETNSAEHPVENSS